MSCAIMGFPTWHTPSRSRFCSFRKWQSEQSKPPYNKKIGVPEGLDWASLLQRDGEELERHYRKILDELGKKSGMLGASGCERQGASRRFRDGELKRCVTNPRLVSQTGIAIPPGPVFAQPSCLASFRAKSSAGPAALAGRDCHRTSNRSVWRTCG